MPVMEGLAGVKTVVAEYDFAVDGGGTGTKTLRAVDSRGNYIPAGAVIIGGYVDVLTSCASATGTMALQAEAAGDLVATVGQANWTAGRKDIVPDSTGSTAVKTTVRRSLALVIATAAFTAGKFRVVLQYI